MELKSKYEIEIENFRKAFSDKKSKRIAVYGTGRRTATLLPGIKDYNIVGLLDRDSNNIGKELCGVKVISIENISDTADLIVINSDPSNYEIIYKRISSVSIPVFYANGEEAHLKTVDDSYMDNPYWESSFEDLKKRVENSDIVSFDLFDTLIMRRVFAPEDVFGLLGKKAEEELNIKGIADVRRQISAKCDAFASLEEIYLKIRQELQLTEEMTKKLIELEKYIDTKLCVPRRKIVELFNYSLALGKDTYIVSDMYYCRKDLEELLNRCGIKGIQPDNIWVSCERKRDKITGSMWKMFADSVIKGRKCIHIGDNVKGDVKNPTYFGIETVYVMSGRDMLLNSSVRELASDIITAEDSVCAGLFVSEVFNNPYALCKSKGKLVFTDSEVYGYSVYGPIITKFLIWLYCNSHKDSIDTLLFFARDGYFLENDYREMMKLLGDVNSQRTEYLPISRRLIYLASAEDEEDFRRIVAFPYVGTFRDYMLSRFNINVTDKSERYNDKQVNAVGDADRLMEWIEPYRQDIEKEISLEKRNYIKYLEKHGLFDRERTFGTVDLGYYGTNQFYLQKLLKRKMEGYCVYACLSQNNVFINEISMKGCFQQDDDPAAERSLIKKKNMYVETFLTAPYGMIRYIDENMNMVCEPDKKSQKNFQIKEKVNEGVLRYLADYVSLFDRNAIMKINNMIEEKLFYNILNGMADISKEILEGFYFDNDFIGGREIGIEA